MLYFQNVLAFQNFLANNLFSNFFTVFLFFQNNFKRTKNNFIFGRLYSGKPNIPSSWTFWKTPIFGRRKTGMGSEVTKIGLRMIINQRLISQSEIAFSFVHLNIKSSFSKHSFLYHFIRFGKMCFCFFSPRGNVE